jgi:hypothetical protein
MNIFLIGFPLFLVARPARPQFHACHLIVPGSGRATRRSGEAFAVILPAPACQAPDAIHALAWVSFAAFFGRVWVNMAFSCVNCGLASNWGERGQKKAALEAIRADRLFWRWGQQGWNCRLVCGLYCAFGVFQVNISKRIPSVFFETYGVCALENRERPVRRQGF